MKDVYFPYTDGINNVLKSTLIKLRHDFSVKRFYDPLLSRVSVSSRSRYRIPTKDLVIVLNKTVPSLYSHTILKAESIYNCEVFLS